MAIRSPLLALLLGACVVLSFLGQPARAAEAISYADDVFPIIQVRCLACHTPGGAGLEQSGLDMRTREGLLKGTKFGPVVVPGDPYTSNLIVLIEGRADPSLTMPHGGKRLTSCEIDIIRRWVKEGAEDN